MDTLTEKKANFFFKKKCAYCSSQDQLELDRIEPFTWVSDEHWKMSEFEFRKFVIEECQVLCNPCYLRKKRVWRAIKNGEDIGLWLHSQC